jgi:hypothetical protein
MPGFRALAGRMRSRQRQRGRAGTNRAVARDPPALSATAMSCTSRPGGAARSRFRDAAGLDPLNDFAALLDIGAFRL